MSTIEDKGNTINPPDDIDDTSSAQSISEHSILRENVDLPTSFDEHQSYREVLDDGHLNVTRDADPAFESEAVDDSNSAVATGGVGYILQKARTAKGMSIEDVARQLRLSSQQIASIECEAYEKLPGRTFLRGFVRNYAILVQLDPAPLLTMLPESARIVSKSENTPLRGKQISFSSERRKQRNHSLPVVVIMSILILGAYFILGNQSQQHSQDVELNVVKETEKSETANTTKEIQLPLTISAAPKESPKETPINSTPGLTAEPRNTNVTSVEVKLDLKPEATVAEQPVPEIVSNKPSNDPSMGNLQFKLHADSWIKVVDGTGANLLEQVRKAGSEYNVTGKRPFTIILGNAAGVNLTYNDEEIDVSSYKNQGGTARFTLE